MLHKGVTREHNVTTEIQAVCRLHALYTILSLPVPPSIISSPLHIKVYTTKEIFLPALTELLDISSNLSPRLLNRGMNYPPYHTKMSYSLSTYAIILS
jgi:hypothetical protein